MPHPRPAQSPQTPRPPDPKLNGALFWGEFGVFEAKNDAPLNLCPILGPPSPPKRPGPPTQSSTARCFGANSVCLKLKWRAVELLPHPHPRSGPAPTTLGIKKYPGSGEKGAVSYQIDAPPYLLELLLATTPTLPTIPMTPAVHTTLTYTHACGHQFIQFIHACMHACIHSFVHTCPYMQARKRHAYRHAGMHAHTPTYVHTYLAELPTLLPPTCLPAGLNT